MVNRTEFDLEDILRNWDYESEQVKADFLEILFDYYQPEPSSHSGFS